MTKSEAEERIAKLRELINDYRYHYHVLDESIMSEAAADSLKHELASLEAEYRSLLRQIRQRNVWLENRLISLKK